MAKKTQPEQAPDANLALDVATPEELVSTPAPQGAPSPEDKAPEVFKEYVNNFHNPSITIDGVVCPFGAFTVTSKKAIAILDEQGPIHNICAR